MFATERLMFREYRKSDIESIARLENDERVMRGLSTGSILPRTAKALEEHHENWASTNLLYCIVELKESGEFVGYCALFNSDAKNRDAMFGPAIAPANWGKGYGTEISRWTIDHAFRFLGLHRVSLVVFQGNEAAAALYKKIGFVHEGTKRQAFWSDGEWKDLHSMGILESEWRAKRQENAALGIYVSGIN